MILVVLVVVLVVAYQNCEGGGAELAYHDGGDGNVAEAGGSDRVRGCGGMDLRLRD